MNLQDLKAAAEAASVIDHNEQEGWYSAECIQSQGAHYGKNARFIAACDPATTLKLIAVVEAAQELLAFRVQFCDGDFDELESTLKELEK